MKFVLGVVWSMTVLKWTGAISWGENGMNFVSFIRFLRILATIVVMGLWRWRIHFLWLAG